VVEAVGRPDLIARQHDAAVIPELDAVFAARPRAEWLALLERDDTCVAPVQEFAEVAADPQFAARSMLIPVPGAPEVRQVGSPIKTTRSAPPAEPAATVGKHTAEVLRQLDLPAEVHRRVARWSQANAEREMSRA
jgi:crotonobetainyl-CoA:carnitine CoA-transferase CaiB-like acyl-CoA transferase